MRKSDNFLTEQKIDSIYQETCDGSLIFSFLIPSFLHLSGYLHAIIVTRTSDDEQIPVLMERVSLYFFNFYFFALILFLGIFNNEVPFKQFQRTEENSATSLAFRNI